MPKGTPDEPDWAEDLRWLAKRHKNYRQLVRDLPFDTTVNTIEEALSGRKAWKFSEEKGRKITKYREALASTAQRVRYALRVLSDALEVMRNGGDPDEQRLQQVQTVVEEEYHKICDTTD